jgi:hypothetical protein
MLDPRFLASFLMKQLNPPRTVNMQGRQAPLNAGAMWSPGQANRLVNPLLTRLGYRPNQWNNERLVNIATRATPMQQRQAELAKFLMSKRRG